MSEGYSLEKYRHAREDHLSPEDQKKLDTFRDAKEQWRKAVHSDDTGLLATALALWSELRQSLLTSTTEHLSDEGKLKYEALEKAHAKTKAGQFELAHQEASFFNDAFNVRKARLLAADAKKYDSPVGIAEYRMAKESLHELVKDLSEGDLNKYSNDIASNRELQKKYDPLTPRDLRRNTEEGMWYPTSAAEETRLMELLIQLPGGSRARDLYLELQDPDLGARDFFDGMSRYYDEETLHQLGRAGAIPHTLITRLPNNRWLRLEFYDNGHIEFSGKDPEIDTWYEEGL
jgi:hypothetical protein